MIGNILGAITCGAIIIAFGELAHGRLLGSVMVPDRGRDIDGPLVDSVRDLKAWSTSDAVSALSSTETLSLSKLCLDASLSTSHCLLLISCEEAASNRGERSELSRGRFRCHPPTSLGCTAAMGSFASGVHRSPWMACCLTSRGSYDGPCTRR